MEPRTLCVSVNAIVYALAAGSMPAGARETDASTSAAESVAADEIIVTARRREERLQDVPIAVQAFGQEALTRKGVLNAVDLVNVTPTLKVTAASNRRVQPSYELRGISSTESNIGQDSPVALYINEVYLGRPIGTNGSFFDLESVQVLLGPQGTLFGRNAAAGAILFTSKKPTDEVEGEVSAGIGNYGRRELGGVVNLPIGDHLAVRFAGQRLRRDGYTRDLTNNRALDNLDDWSSRISIRAKFDRFENLLVGDTYRSNTNGSGIVPIALRLVSTPRAPGQPVPTLAALNGDAAISALIARQAARGPREVEFSPGFLANDNATARGFSNITTYELSDNLTLKNIFGYRYVKVDSAADLDGTPFLGILVDGGEKSHNFSNELQLQGSSPDKALSYIVGVYYFNEKGYFQVTSPQFVSSSWSLLNGHGINKSYSIFAQGTYALPFIENLSLTAGARYTRDERRMEYLPPTAQMRALYNGTPPACSFTIPNPSPPPTLANNPTCHAGPTTVKFNKPTWTLSLDYKAAPDLLLYLAHRRGYRAGGG